MSEAIETMLGEGRLFQPPASKDANIASMDQYRAIVARFEADFEGTWKQLANENLLWRRPFSTVLNDSNAPFFKWFEDGELNLSENCLDRHVDAGLGDRTAIIWEGEPGDVRKISYRELLHDVSRAANGMKALGVEPGDRVVIYMPMIPEAAVAMLACTRIGATHSVVFGAFSSQSLCDRIDDAQAKLVVTADGGYRRGSVHALKPAVDEALSRSSGSVQHVLVVKRGGNEVSWTEGRDLHWHEVLAAQSADCEPLAVSAGRYRLDYRPHLFCLWSALQWWHHRDV